MRTNIKSPRERVNIGEEWNYGSDSRSVSTNLHGGVSSKLIPEGCVEISEAKKERMSVLVIGVCNA